MANAVTHMPTYRQAGGRQGIRMHEFIIPYYCFAKHAHFMSCLTLQIYFMCLKFSSSFGKMSGNTCNSHVRVNHSSWCFAKHAHFMCLKFFKFNWYN